MRRLFSTPFKFSKMQPAIFSQRFDYNWKYVSMIAALSATGLAYHNSESNLFKPL